MIEILDIVATKHQWTEQEARAWWARTASDVGRELSDRSETEDDDTVDARTGTD